MNTEIISLIIFGCVVGAVLIGKAFHRLLPEDHLSADTKETVKLAMGLLATMSALLLGLLVASAKSSYDNARNQVIEMAAKVAFLDRVLIGMGRKPETSVICFARLLKTRRTECSRSRQTRSQN